MTDLESNPNCFDVVIMGAGPGGTTLAALLRRRSGLRVAIVEKAPFPRDRIGESFSYRVIPALEASGALKPVLESGCWVKKYGGFYAWNPERPAATFFEHHHHLVDGVHRWAIHCNRADFDAILLEHARSVGAEVRMPAAVAGVRRRSRGGFDVALSDGTQLVTRLFVEAAGRQTSLVTGELKSHLSQFENVAVWTHVLGGRPPQTLPGEWNFFREPDLSPIGSFAFEDGWYWYIPVPKIVNGERVVTHSLGMVTDPAQLKGNADVRRSSRALLAHAQKVPLLRDLIAEATPIDAKVHVATNYSMVSERFCDFDEGWILLGDSAFFVDPLFSSGVAFAVHEAAGASLLIREALGGSRSADECRDLWRDYDASWHRLASSFALVIDQWYHAIAEAHPESVYWRRKSVTRVAGLQTAAFQAVVDTAVSPDLVRVLTRDVDDLEAVLSRGPIAELRRASGATEDAPLALSPGVRYRAGLSVGVGQSRGTYPPGEPARPGSPVARYWEDPLSPEVELPPMYEAPVPCWYFDDGARLVRAPSEEVGRRVLQACAGGGRPAREIMAAMSPLERQLMGELVAVGMVRHA